MRIAISGVDRVDTAALVAGLASQLPAYWTVDKTWTLNEGQRGELSEPPGVEDIEGRLRSSLARSLSLPRDAIVDRCPLDFVAYLYAIDADYDLDPLRAAIADAMAAFGLVVLVRTGKRRHPNPPVDLRCAVDEQLHLLVTGDALGLGIETIEVWGSLDARVEQVLAALYL